LSTLYSIDQWIDDDDCRFAEKQYKVASNILEKYGNRSKILRMTSREASKLFKSESLDFIYVDADHSYESCKEDIELWWPKLKKGGIFSGDDYVNDPVKNWKVKKAVDEFVKSKNQKLIIFYQPKRNPGWYLFKRGS
jgi:predicted O-methyltransferase YrrM